MTETIDIPIRPGLLRRVPANSDEGRAYRQSQKPRVSKGCKACHTPGNALVVNQGAGGLGDALIGSCAIKGLAKLHVSRHVVYKINPAWHTFMQLFDLGGNVTLGVHDWDNGNERPKGDPHPADLQMNIGYGYELQTKGKFSRLDRNCRNIGGVIPELPSLKDRDALAEHGKDFAGAIALSPFSTWRTREYPIQNWLTLERLLREEGYRVVVLDAPNATFPDRHKPLKSEIVYNAPAERVAGVILSASMLIGNDSGLAHLAGIMGVPTLVLCGQVTGPEIYGFYGQHMHYLDGHLDCKGCWWQAPFNANCEPTCPDLASITPAEIVTEVKRISGSPKQPPYGETSKAHARRLREGWYAEYVHGPCLDVGCWVDYLQPGFPCRRWDQMYGDGDATQLAGVPDGSYATVYASHMLEHVVDPVAALRNWWRVLKPGGTLIVCVPHRDLYEGKRDLPSRWNGDHKTFWLPGLPAPDDPPHTRGLQQTIGQAGLSECVVYLRVLDEGHSYQDKAVHPQGEFSIEAVLRKP